MFQLDNQLLSNHPAVSALAKEPSEKAKKIMDAALVLLSKKGYENTTINDIADEAKMSRGLLHYYFTSKEDLVAKALDHGFGPMWDASFGRLSSAGTVQELVDAMIDVLKQNVEKNPDFTALLFETWVSGRRSAKIKRVFSEGFEEAISRMDGLLKLASAAKVDDIDPS